MALVRGRPTGPGSAEGKLHSLARSPRGATKPWPWDHPYEFLARAVTAAGSKAPANTLAVQEAGRPPGVPQARRQGLPGGQGCRWSRWGLGDPFSPNTPTQDRVRKCTPPLWLALREPGKKGDFEPRKVKLMSTRLESGQNASSSRLASLPSSLMDPHCLALGIPASLLTSYITCK